MLGDRAQPDGSDDAPHRVPPGPRHAAPRKSLLTKLHVPAGKAVALAAMPTAVLMGMGFTPHLAQADEMPKNPFKPGPCVSQSDSPTASASPSAGSTDKAGDKAENKPASSKASGTSTAKTAPKPSASPSASPTPKSTPKSTPTPETTKAPDKAPLAATRPQASPSPSPSASPSTSTASRQSANPLDPLGLGNLLGGLLGTNGTPTPSPTTASPAPTTSPAPAPSGGASPAPPAPGPSSGGSSSTAPTSSSTSKSRTKDSAKGSTDAVHKAVKDLTGPSAAPTPRTTHKAATKASEGPQPYPCPTHDAKALADADVETGIPLLPDASWTLRSTRLNLHGLNYDGIVKVRTWNGQVKDVLKFTATGIDIFDLWQITDGPKGTHTWVKGAPGSESTFRDGTVTMYTESLSGNLLGLVPVTFTPDAPPPLVLPELFFTDVTVINAAQFGGTLHIPGMQVLPNQP